MTNETLYTSGKYLETSQSWHAEDSPWKAKQISKVIRDNRLCPKQVAEIGCGAGLIINELSRVEELRDTQFWGYDISPFAIQLAKRHETSRVRFFCEDLFAEGNREHFDVLLAIDVYEHIPDYMGFLAKCRMKANYKIYHIPLDLHVSSVLRNVFLNNRYSMGHLHYFTADSAIATLKDTGHDVIDSFYTNPCMQLFREHPSVKRAIANVPRWLCSKISMSFSARIFGGYSLLVLAR
ncbi:class I SAM-dependent methyltransferase [Nitrospira sp. KM1]|uniref:class I SAM-dependent methyltransferase n=1 Tax=Nitrospira sp. KM1 TaxID=1936990 RepID=UPI00156618DF